MRNLYPYLQENRKFWWARNCLQRLRFSIVKSVFRINYGIQNEADRSRTLFGFVRITLPQLVFAITFAFLLKEIDVLLPTLFPIGKWQMPEDGDYTTLLATIAGIGGVFIGLYYAGVTTVGSSIYSRVPNNVRDLLARERVGIAYMRYLAFLTFLALTLICFKVLGMPRIRVAAIVITILSGIGVVAFVKLGGRAFNLFDPTALSDSLFRELQQLTQRASVGGFGWLDPSFQNHANKIARTAIATLETLAEISGTEKNLSGRPFAELCKGLLRFLIFYEKTKATIPSDSYWYTRQNFHRDWYRSEDSRVSLAHLTGSALDPDNIPNRTWVEDRLVRIVIRCIVTNTKERQYDIVSELIGYFDLYIKTLCNESNLGKSLDLVETLTRDTFPILTPSADALVLEGETLEAMGLVDCLAALPITLILTFIESISVGSVCTLSDRLKSVEWDKKDSIYTRKFKAHLLPRLEWLKPRLEFEHLVEGRIVSPLWYQCDMIRVVDAKKYEENIRVLFDKVLKAYKGWGTFFETNKHPWLTAAVLGREWEYSRKMQAHLSRCEQGWNSLMADRKLQGLDWPDLDPKTWKKIASDLEGDVESRMAAVSLVLSLSKRIETFPDYQGQFLHAAGESTFNSLVMGDVEKIKKLYPVYFAGCLAKFDELRPSSFTADDESARKLRIAGASLLDILTLSGYGKLFAELHGKPEIWTSIKAIWDSFLAVATPSPVPVLSGIIALTEVHIAIPHRAVLRTAWAEKVNRALRDVPRRDVVSGGGFISVERVAIHSSPLVRIFARDHASSFYDGKAIFSALYLSKRAEGGSLSWGNKCSSLILALERQENENLVDT